MIPIAIRQTMRPVIFPFGIKRMIIIAKTIKAIVRTALIIRVIGSIDSADGNKKSKKPMLFLTSD